MTARTIKDITRSLQVHFSAAKTPLSLPAENRSIIQNFVEEHDGQISDEESARANLELKMFWEKYVGDSPQKLGLFMGVLKELRPSIVGTTSIIEWWELVVKPVICGTAYNKAVIEDARDFLVGVMVHDEDQDDAHQRAKITSQLCSDLLAIYITRSSTLTEEDEESVAAANGQIVEQVVDVLVAFGRKRPKHLFNGLDDLVVSANTRLQALTLLSSFLRHQAPHLYLVINTPLVEHLLKCLINDTSTTVLSVALTSLIMLLPHIPSSLGPHLPRLFLIYSRLLCWEKFSPLSTEAQKSVVTDDRVANYDSEEPQDLGDIGIDLNWERAEPQEGLIEAATPELMTYFTYLYGLYPLNFMNYIRKPRRYLKDIQFPGADIFDLDQAVIRSRTDQFRQVHLLHPNFYDMTVEEELADPKWPKMDPADVVGLCHGLCINSGPQLASPGPLPSGKLPEPSPISALSAANIKMSGQLSPATSYASINASTNWRDTQSSTGSAAPPVGDSPILRPKSSFSDDRIPTDQLRPSTKASRASIRPSPSPEDFPQPSSTFTPRSYQEKAETLPSTNIAYLQREITLLRNDLNFEKWHKAQYSQHIGQIMRRNVKEATVEAETLNLINANRALKKQLDQVRKAREATVKDSALTRKQANNLEANMTERFNKLKLEQETWQADAEELKRLRSEMKQYRDLLVATEARELNKSHQLEIVNRGFEQLQKIQAQFQHAQRRLHEYEYREFEFESSQRQNDILNAENQKLQIRLQQQEQSRESLRRAYASKVLELEGRLGLPVSPTSVSGGRTSANIQLPGQRAVADSEAKLIQLQKAHSRLSERFMDLELEYQLVRSQLEKLQGGRIGQTSVHGDRDILSFDASEPGDDVFGEYERTYTAASAGQQAGRRFQPAIDALGILPASSRDGVHALAGVTFEPSRTSSFVSRSSGAKKPAAFNQSTQLSTDETKSASSDGSGAGGSTKSKIQAEHNMRMFGRGGAQNVKLKQKNGQNGDGTGDENPGG